MQCLRVLPVYIYYAVLNVNGRLQAVSILRTGQSVSHPRLLSNELALSFLAEKKCFLVMICHWHLFPFLFLNLPTNFTPKLPVIMS